MPFSGYSHLPAQSGQNRPKRWRRHSARLRVCDPRGREIQRRTAGALVQQPTKDQRGKMQPCERQ